MIQPEVESSEHGPLIVAQTRDCYDATLLVDDAWWEQTATRVKGELLACVPARHVVLIGGTARAGTIAELRAAAERIEVGGDHSATLARGLLGSGSERPAHTRYSWRNERKS